MASKALLIRSNAGGKSGDQGKWNAFGTEVLNYIKGISLGELAKGRGIDKQLYDIISGMPTPWARVKLFRLALSSGADADKLRAAEGLAEIYSNLIGEWKGLIALLALYRDRIRFSRPVYLDGKEGLRHEITESLGNMLFDDRDLWSNQDENDIRPYIQLIYYNDRLLGGTSPYSAVFTGVAYELGRDADVKWYRNGKLEDPLPSLRADEIQKLYLFVKNMNQRLVEFEEKINSKRGNKSRIDIEGLKDITKAWSEELLATGNKELALSGQKLYERGPIAGYGNLQVPFSTLFDNRLPVYYKRSENSFTFNQVSGEGYDKIENIQDLLSKGEFLLEWTEEVNVEQSYKDSPVYFLKVKESINGGYHFFSVPLSEKGLSFLGYDPASLLDYDRKEDAAAGMKAELKDDKVIVTLSIKVDGTVIELNPREYTVKNVSIVKPRGHVIVWPNFVSDNWSKYYLYNEFVRGDEISFQAYFKRNGTLCRNRLGDLVTTDLKSEENAREDFFRNLVGYPDNPIRDDKKYDIFESDIPFAGVKAFVKKGMDEYEEAGLLPLREDGVHIKQPNVTSTSDVVVGFDFGSSNTCVYYDKDKSNSPRPVEFQNLRAVLVGKENSNPKSVADIDELLFFSNYPSLDGQMKSCLHDQGPRHKMEGNEDQPVAGGVPVNRPNVQVEKMDDKTITTQAGILHYNMKWLRDEMGEVKRKSFINNVWLQVCANLYSNGLIPTEISWSYPGAMMEDDSFKLGKIFSRLSQKPPFKERKEIKFNDNGTTEAEAVCNFARSVSNQMNGLDTWNLILGMDIGGSTSDLLILGTDPKNGNVPTLFRENSVRLAAGVFFDAVTKSERFRNSLLRYHESKKSKIYVENIQEINDHPEKAYYYLNSVFDQLTRKDYESFYDSLADMSHEVFTIPSFVLGILIYYSGMLVGETLQKHGLDGVSKVDIFPFGNGGRLFDWLKFDTTPSTCENYFGACLNAGLHQVLPDREDLEVHYYHGEPYEYKSSVAQGLTRSETLEFSKTEKHDICGERGVIFTPEEGGQEELAASDRMTGDHFRQFNRITFSEDSRMPCFKEYLSLFTEFAKKTRSCEDAAELENDLKRLPSLLKGFITLDAEYKNAQDQEKEKGKGFKYHQPLIIAEASCFLRDCLIPKVFQSR